MLYRKIDPFYFTLLFLLVLISCSQPEKKLEEKQLVDDPATLNHFVRKHIETASGSGYCADKEKLMTVSHLPFADVTEDYYYGYDYMPVME
jgi:hypothetical protein